AAGVAVAQPARAPERRLGIAADQQWRPRVLPRLGLHGRGRHIVERALVADLVLRPHRIQALDELVHPLAAATPRRADRIVLILRPPDAQTDREPSVAHHFERAELLAERARGIEQTDEHAGPVPAARGLG